MRTLILGGSFDPIHNGHLFLAKSAKEKLNADRVLFLIAKYPRWKETTATNQDRLNMLELALKGKQGYEISLLEYNSNEKVNYTYNTLKAYPKQENEEIYFLFGADQLEKLHLWYEIDKLCKLVHLVCYNRPGYKLDLENAKKYNVEVIDIAVSTMSSSAFRALQEVDAPKEVLDYIVEHELYYMQDIKKFIKEHRYYHSISVANTCYKIALTNGYNTSKAYIAGLLHDIAKQIPIEEQIAYIKENVGEAYLSVTKPLYHQFMGVYICQKYFHITDEEILNAIGCHATGKANMATLDKILYASDKIEPTRGYDSSKSIEACCKNIDDGFKMVLEENVKFFIEKGIQYDNFLTMECINYYLKGENK